MSKQNTADESVAMDNTPEKLNDSAVLCRRLVRTARWLRIVDALRGLIATVLLLGLIFVGYLYLDKIFILPSALRLVASVVWAVIAIISLGMFFIRPVFLFWRDTANILLLEKSVGVDDNILINFWSLFSENAQIPKAFSSLLYDQTAETLGAIPHTKLLQLSLWKNTLVRFVALILAAIATFHFYPSLATEGWRRYVYVLRNQPPASSLILNVTPSETVKVFSGDDVSVRVNALRNGKWAGNDLSMRLELGNTEGGSFVREGEGKKMELLPVSAKQETPVYISTLNNLKHSQMFVVNAGETWTAPVDIIVLLRPFIKSTEIIVAPPEFSGLPKRSFFSISQLPRTHSGSAVSISAEIGNPLDDMWFELDGKKIETVHSGNTVSTRFKLDRRMNLSLHARSSDPVRELVLDESMLPVSEDTPPEVILQSDSPKLIALGSNIKFKILAKDNLGLKEVGLISANKDNAESTQEDALKKWTSSKAPGRSSAALNYELPLPPGKYFPGQSYVFKAYAVDYNPQGKRTFSMPVTVRIATNGELSVPGNTPMAQGFKYLREAVEQQKSALSFTENMQASLTEILGKKDVRRQYERLVSLQFRVRSSVGRAHSIFSSVEECQTYSDALKPVVKNLIPGLIKDIEALPSSVSVGQLKVKEKISSIAGQQAYVYTLLQQLLGKVYQESIKANSKLNTDNRQPPVNAQDVIKDTVDALKKFTEDQRKILERSKSLLDKPADDVSDENDRIIGELAAKEAELAAFLQEKLTDFSKMPSQDFSDSAVIEEFNEVYQEIQKAAAELYARRVELAVPREQAGLESAETLIQNLERWLPDHADNIQWSMEELDLPPEAPVAELPDELEDIIGDLLEEESDMTEDIEDIGSTYMDSLDKGAGWGAADGPISNMSARGVTGNILPNQMEVGGRSGEGRSGRSSGQMVEASADGKGGRKTPTRLTPTPFETGSVDDKSKEEPGGATGGGKLSGFSEEGLRGPVPADLAQKMARIQQKQTGIRQKAEQVLLQLKKMNLPDKELQKAISTFKEFENAAASGQAQKLRQLHRLSVDALSQSKSSVRQQTSTTQQNAPVRQGNRSEIYRGMRESAPRGYEKMTDKYFDSILELN